MKCPKCGEECKVYSEGGTIIEDILYCCEDERHGYYIFNSEQQAEIARLRKCLERIAEHEHCQSGNCSYPHDRSYLELKASQIGHRCCAAIAREGLK